MFRHLADLAVLQSEDLEAHMVGMLGGDGGTQTIVNEGSLYHQSVTNSCPPPENARPAGGPGQAGSARRQLMGGSCWSWSRTLRNRSPVWARRGRMLRIEKASGRRSGSSSSSQSMGADTGAPGAGLGL